MKKFLNLLNAFKGADTKESGHFSDFFLRATIEKKKEVFTEAARRANMDQRKVLNQSDLGLKAR